MKGFRSLKRWQQGCFALVVLFLSCGMLSALASLIPIDVSTSDGSRLADAPVREVADSAEFETVAEPVPTLQPTEEAATPVPTQVPATDVPTIPPTAEPTETPAPAPVLVSPLMFSGSGDQFVDVGDYDGLSLLRATHSGSHNFAISALDSSNQLIDLEVNTIGNYSGTRLIESLLGGEMIAYEVKADGDWVIELLPLGDAALVDGTLSGFGDAVVRIEPGSGRSINISHEGEGNFAVLLMGGLFPDLAINTIGDYMGTVRLDPDAFYAEITADGDWEFSINQ